MIKNLGMVGKMIWKKMKMKMVEKRKMIRKRMKMKKLKMVEKMKLIWKRKMIWKKRWRSMNVDLAEKDLMNLGVKMVGKMI